MSRPRDGLRAIGWGASVLAAFSGLWWLAEASPRLVAFVVFFGMFGTVYRVSRPTFRAGATIKFPRRLRFTIGQAMLATVVAAGLAGIARLVVDYVNWRSAQAGIVGAAPAWQAAGAVVLTYVCLGFIAYFCWSLLALIRLFRPVRSVPKEAEEV